jgi:hypothetical protein
MPQPNRYYNDPNLGAAFSNLAAAFAPPSGSDLAGYATAAAKRQEAARLAEFYNYAKDPNYSREMADRLGIGVGAFGPNQSYYSVDQSNLTSRANNQYSADQSLAGTKYTSDNAYKASTENNAADNTRAITTNAADNTRAITTNAADNTQKSIAALYGPLNANQSTPVIPSDVAGLVGLPEAIPARRGIVTLNQGERATLPDGQVFNGAAKPLTETELAAQQQAKLVEDGVITQQQLADAITGKNNPVQTVGPDGKTPIYMTPGAATRTNAQPYNPSADNTAMVEGTAVINGVPQQVFRRANDSQYYTADKQPLPSGTQVFDKAHPTGSSADVGLKPTEASDKAGIFYSRAAPASANMDAAIGGGYQPSDVDYETAIGVMSNLPNALNRHFTSEEGRKFYNDAQNFMMSVLRPDTGAAFGAEEFQSYAKVFIPMPGDNAETLKAKSVARQTALAALQGTSRGSAENIARILQSQGLAIPKEMADVIARGGISTKTGIPTSPQAGAPTPPPAVDVQYPNMPAEGQPGSKTSPVAVQSPEEAAKLAPGTWIMVPGDQPGTTTLGRVP